MFLSTDEIFREKDEKNGQVAMDLLYIRFTY